MALNEGRGWRANADNQVERMLRKERAQIFNKWSLCVFVAWPSGYKRVVEYVDRPRRLPFQLSPDGFAVFTPRFEIATEGVNDHHSLGIARNGNRASPNQAK
jgi:hypothetical protein